MCMSVITDETACVCMLVCVPVCVCFVYYILSTKMLILLAK